MSITQQHVVYSILSYLQAQKTAETSDDIDTAISLLENAFGMSLSTSSDFKTYSYYPTRLSTIFEDGVNASKLTTYGDRNSAVENNPKFVAFFDAVSEKGYFEGTTEDSVEYLSRHAKLIQKFNERMLGPGEKNQEEKEALAEEKKVQGNTAVSNKDYETAIQYYTEALDLSSSGPNSHVYYCNRAAAYCYLHEYNDAVADCEASLALSPDYIKAHSRLGLASFFLGNYEKAVEAYSRADELEPNNESTKKSLKQARKKLDETKKAVTTSSTGGKSTVGTAAGPGGLPDMSSMLNDPNLAGMMNSPFMKDAMTKLGGRLLVYASFYFCSIS